MEGNGHCLKKIYNKKIFTIFLLYKFKKRISCQSPNYIKLIKLAEKSSFLTVPYFKETLVKLSPPLDSLLGEKVSPFPPSCVCVSHHLFLMISSVVGKFSGSERILSRLMMCSLPRSSSSYMSALSRGTYRWRPKPRGPELLDMLC